MKEGGGRISAATIEVLLDPPNRVPGGPGISEQRFGRWTALLRPGGGSDTVLPRRAATVESDGFSEAIDLCVTHALALAGGVVVHGAAFESAGCGVVAAGGSGSGKSSVTAAALRRETRVVSDDLLLVANLPSSEIRATSLRSELFFRKPGMSALPQKLKRELQPFSYAGEARWRLAPKADPSRFVGSTRPEHLWLVSVDRRLRESRQTGSSQADALSCLIRGISGLFLTEEFFSERRMILGILVNLVESCTTSRVRLGRDLLSSPAETIGRFLAFDGEG